MIQAHVKYASRTVPRYTSYPTAPHFSDAVNGEACANWLRTLPGDEAISLYLHVPFCREMCHYCGCNTKATRKLAPVAAYAQTLLKEIDLVGETLGKRLRVQHIHWGGGTPSMLARDDFLALLTRLRRYFDFDATIEHAIELDPRTVTPYLAQTLRMGGITRASLGVQDFDGDVQRKIGRVQPFEQVVNAVAALRAEGIEAINFDLMYGLPGQSEQTILDSVAKTAELAPGRVALFGYAHVPWFKKHQQLIKEADLPSADERILLNAVSREALVKAGYEAIGLDHFALPSDDMAIALRERNLRRNFQGYTTDTADTLIGFGPSSIGFLPNGGYYQNSPDARGWARQVEAGQLPVCKGVEVSCDDKCRSAIIMQLMTYYEVDVASIAKQYGCDLNRLSDGFERLEELVRDGLVHVYRGKITLSDEGRRYVRVAASAFDAYLPQQQARHSVAV
ncbi:oxygen-independent coproporphyrinogen III oxidase [Polycladidibacter hongkongensis]|uniref:oxygen-independent coproporphyrinogen III oxidase n=1 Tax=Polycladidibacter hongkongensis TaxID=1647556 RepID=UPI00082DFE70|nr:oxygen-independent coproporphyrinogen III oxidase [Pseudovibrio hongkongensis]